MKQQWIWGACLYSAISLCACIFSITLFSAPDTATTGSVITLTLAGTVQETGTGAAEQGIVLQIPEDWQVRKAWVVSPGNPALTEAAEYGVRYTPEPGYRIWVGTLSHELVLDSETVTVKADVMTGTFDGVPGSTRTYTVKAATGSLRTGEWMPDDPSAIYDFAQITADLYVETVMVEKVTDGLPPVAVEELVVTELHTGTDVRLDWRNYDESVSNDVVAYRVFRSTASFWNVAGMTPVGTVPAGEQSFIASGLTPGEEYFFAVTAGDEESNEVITVTPVAVTPQQVTGSIAGLVVENVPDCVLEPCEQTGLEGAEVALRTTSLSYAYSVTGTTGADGSYAFLDVPEGSYTLAVEKCGYTGDVFYVQVADNQVTTVPDALLERYMYTQEQLGKVVADAVAAEQMKWDADGDGQLGLAEAIRALQVVAGMRDNGPVSVP